MQTQAPFSPNDYTVLFYFSKFYAILIQLPIFIIFRTHYRQLCFC